MTPYHLSSNCQVERYNRTLINVVRCYLQGKQSRWDECVPQVAAALKTAVNGSTGCTPNRLMLGQEVNTPLELMFAPPLSSEREEEDPLLIHLTTLKQDIQDAHAQAWETLKTTQKSMKADYDIKARGYQYTMGMSCTCNKASMKGICDKLKSPWKDPGLVLAMLTPYLMKIQIRNSVTVVNHDHI